MAFGIETTTQGNSPGGGATSLTFAYNSTASNLLVVQVGAGGSAGPRTVSGVTYNGVVMTDKGNADDTNFCRVTFFVLDITGVTGSHNVVITMGGTALIGGGATGFTGADTTNFGTLATGHANDNSPTITVVSTTGSIVLAAVSSDANAIILEGGAGVQQWKALAIGADCCFGGESYAGSASVVASYTATPPDTGWAMAGLGINPAGGAAIPIIGKQSGHIFQVLIDLNEIASSIVGKPRGGGPAPTPPSYKPQIRTTTPFYDDFDYYGTVTQTIGAGPGILPKLTAPNRFINNPFYFEPEFNTNNSITIPSKGGAAPPVKSVYNHIFYNPLFIDTQFDFSSSVIQTGNKKGAMVGFPRRVIKNPSDIAIQLQNELNYWDRYFVGRNLKPAQGGSSPQPGTGALLLGGFIGVHVGVGRL